jgi:hypothetical protein
VNPSAGVFIFHPSLRPACAQEASLNPCPSVSPSFHFHSLVMLVCVVLVCVGGSFLKQSASWRWVAFLCCGAPRATPDFTLITRASRNPFRNEQYNFIGEYFSANNAGQLYWQTKTRLG